MQLNIDQSDITRTECAPQPDSPLAPGQARLALRRCALTANNITYAAAGVALSYWDFFPSGTKGQGLLPVWGTADVIESESPDLPVDTRLYGFWPLAETCVLSPKRDAHGAIVDTAPHRAELPAVYNRYAEVKPGAPRDEDLRALLQPLLATSYLLADFLEDNGYFGARQIIVGSASSKTGLGLCKFLAEHEPRPVRIVGLTSAGNTAFVQGLGACDEVRSYDEIGQIAQVPSVYVDMAGNSAAKQALHSHLAEHLTHSAAVGMSHWDKFRPDAPLDGVKPQFFFAPAQIAKRREEWGPGEIEKRITAGWKRLAEGASDWLDIRTHDGLAEAQKVYTQIATGQAAPRDGHVIVL